MPELQVTACMSVVEAGLQCLPFRPALQSLEKLLLNIQPSLTVHFSCCVITGIKYHVLATFLPCTPLCHAAGGAYDDHIEESCRLCVHLGASDVYVSKTVRPPYAGEGDRSGGSSARHQCRRRRRRPACACAPGQLPAAGRPGPLRRWSTSACTSHGCALSIWYTSPANVKVKRGAIKEGCVLNAMCAAMSA